MLYWRWIAAICAILTVLQIITLSSAVDSTLIPTSDRPLKILVMQHGFSRSHLRFAGSLAQILAKRGHTLDYVIQYYNPSVVPLNPEAFRNIYDVRIDDKRNGFLKMNHMSEPFEHNNDDFFWGPGYECFTRAISELCDATLGNDTLIAALRAERYDIVLTSAYTLCPYALAYDIGTPSVIGFIATAGADQINEMLGVPLPPSFVSSSFGELFDHTNFFQRLKTFTHLWKKQYFTTFWEERRTIETRLPDAPSADKLLSRMAYLLMNTDEIIDYGRPTSSKLKFIGGIASESAKTPPIDAKLAKLLDLPSRGVIVMSFGSFIRTGKIPIAKKKAIIEAFSHFNDYTFVWKYDEVEADAPLFVNATNVHLVKWLPQVALLRHPRVRAFISHMGQNSYIELAEAGIPTIAIPIFADQFYNADVAVQKGIAVQVDKVKLSPELLIDALNNVLTNPKYTTKARDISRMLAQKPGRIDADAFVHLVEYAAAFPTLGSEVLQMTSTDLNLFQIYCYDIVLTLVAIFIGILLAAYYIASSVISRLVFYRRRSVAAKNKTLQPKSQ